MTSRKQLPPAYEETHQWLDRFSAPLIVTHRRPDGDAVGSAVALALMLGATRPATRIYFDQELFPPQLTPFVPSQFVSDGSDLTGFDSLVCLDCAVEDRLGLPEDVCFDDISLPCVNIDHHVSNDGYGEVNLVDDSCAATAEILTRLAANFPIALPADAATALLTGITQDTGCFRFNNTTPDVLAAGAWLMQQGGDYLKVMDELYFNVPIQLMRLQAKVIESTKLAYDNRLAYFAVTDELMASCGATAEEADDLIDIVRTMAGVVITCRLQQVGSDVRFSLRSQDPTLPILPMAREIGGGGHAMAAGATMSNATFEQAEARLLELAGEVLNG